MGGLILALNFFIFFKAREDMSSSMTSMVKSPWEEVMVWVARD